MMFLFGNDDLLGKLITKSAFIAVLKFFGFSLTYIIAYLISNKFGVEAVGAYYLYIKVTFLFAGVFLFGYDKSIVRYIPQLLSQGEEYSVSKIVSFSFGRVVLSSFLVLASVLLVSFFASDLLMFSGVEFKWGFFFSIPLYAITLIYVEVLRSFGRVVISELLRGVVWRSWVLLSITLAVLAGEKLDAVELSYFVSASFLFSSTVVVLIVIFLYGRDFISLNFRRTSDSMEFSRVSRVFYQSNVLVVCMTNVPVMILAYQHGAEQVGFYEICFLLASITSFALSALTTVISPKISELYWGGQQVELKQLIEKISSYLMLFGVGVGLILFLLSKPMLNFYGEAYVEYQHVLALLILSSVINVLTGSAGSFLDMVGEHKLRRNITLLSFFVVFTLGVFLTNKYGALGLAIVVALRSVLSNVIAVVFIRYKYDILTVCLPFVRARHVQ